MPKCRRSIPTSVQSAFNPENIYTAFTLSASRRAFASRPIFPRGRMRERKSLAVATPRRAVPRGSPRKKSSVRDAIILPDPCSRFFWIAKSIPPSPGACNAPALFYRAPALITRHRAGYYRGNAKRPSFWSLLPPLLFSPPLALFSERAPNRNVTLLARDSILLPR